MKAPHVELETCPINEKCVQVLASCYELLALIECNIYLAQLNRQFNKRPKNVKLKIEKYPHDSSPVGFYYEVVAQYPRFDEKAENYAYEMQDKLPMNWDKTSLAVIEKFPEYVAYREGKIVNEDNTITSHVLTQKVLDAIQLIEENGGVVMIPEPTTETLPDHKERKNTFLSVGAIAKAHGYTSIEEMILELNDEPTVEACCIYGCKVEPDGICEHGNNSVYLEMGII